MFNWWNFYHVVLLTGYSAGVIHILSPHHILGVASRRAVSPTDVSV